MQLISQKIYQIIESITPCDDKEMAHKAYVLDWIASGADLFRKSPPATPDPHLVCYFVLIDASSNKVLLTDHKKAKLWLPSGGHVEQDEDPKETVRREAKEELGLEPDFLFQDPLFLTVTATQGLVTPHTDVSLWYVLKGDASQVLHFDREEFLDICWFPMDALPLARTDPHLERFTNKLMQHIGSK